LVTAEKLECYQKYKQLPLLVEGPEQDKDLSYYLVDKNEDLQSLEQGILLDDFVKVDKARNFAMEFRILTRMTQHKEHVKNLFYSVSSEFMAHNRWNDILPFAHSRVLLKDPPSTEKEKGTSSELEVGYN
jgi:protein tyrosine phosphatase